MMNMAVFDNYFTNKYSIEDNVCILDNDDKYTKNFGKQWKKYRNVQIDSLNNFNISENFLDNLLFKNTNILKNKTVLEVGCGAGRFTEHIVKLAKTCVSVDLSSAIFFNVSKDNRNLCLIKADILKLISKEKFDIVICRGMIQHTPNPYKTILKLFDFIDKNGQIYFDVYPKPKIGFFHPKYFLWRPFFQKLIKYEKMDNFLNNNIRYLLKIKRIVKKILFNNNFLSDCLVPIWDYHNRLNLDKYELEKWSILDTLDGLYAQFDNPLSHKEICDFLISKDFLIINKRKDLNCFQVKLKSG